MNTGEFFFLVVFFCSPCLEKQNLGPTTPPPDHQRRLCPLYPVIVHVFFFFVAMSAVCCLLFDIDRLLPSCSYLAGVANLLALQLLVIWCRDRATTFGFFFLSCFARFNVCRCVAISFSRCPHYYALLFSVFIHVMVFENKRDE